MVIKYQPTKIINNIVHTIGTLMFNDPETAKEYARKRGLKDEEIYIKTLVFEEEWVVEWNSKEELD